MRYIEGVRREKWPVKVGVFERVDARSPEDAKRILSARLAAAGFTTIIPYSKEDDPACQDYDVAVIRTLKTTVRVRAKNPESAAAQVDSVNFPLPEKVSDWSGNSWHYVVCAPGSDLVLYSGESGELDDLT